MSKNVLKAAMGCLALFLLTAMIGASWAAPQGACRITGMVFCTEYGTPYKDDAALVFDGPGRISADVNTNDGTFVAELPCGASYEMRIHYCSRGIYVGKLDIPECPTGGSDMKLDIHYPGSMLEMVHWAESGNPVEGITFQATPVQAPVLGHTTTVVPEKAAPRK
jgi:hypothetical protein